MFEIHRDDRSSAERVWSFDGDLNDILVYGWDSDQTGQRFEEAVDRYFQRLNFQTTGSYTRFGHEIDNIVNPYGDVLCRPVVRDSETDERRIRHDLHLRFCVECKDWPNGRLTPHYIYRTVSIASLVDAIPVLALTTIPPASIRQLISEWKIPVINLRDILFTKGVSSWCRQSMIDRWLGTGQYYGESIPTYDLPATPKEDRLELRRFRMEMSLESDHRDNLHWKE